MVTLLASLSNHDNDNASNKIKKAIGLISKTKNPNVHTIWWISSPPMYDYDVKHDQNDNAMVL